MYDPMCYAREFDAAYGLAPIDVRKRERAVTLVTVRAAAISENTEQLTNTLWSLIGDLEGAASDEVLREDLKAVAGSMGEQLLELYATAARLGIGDALYPVVARLHRARMSSFEAEGYAAADLDDLIVLPA